MASVTCVACGAEVSEFDTLFADVGQVCPSCHTADEAASSAAFQAGAEGMGAGHLGGPGLDGRLGSSTTRVHIDEDGRHTVTTTSFTVNAGPLGMLIQLIMRLFRR